MSLFEVLYHIFICPLMCVLIHIIFHKRYDKKHMHINYLELAKNVAQYFEVKHGKPIPPKNIILKEGEFLSKDKVDSLTHKHD